MNGELRFVVSPEAWHEMRATDLWWREHRPSAPDLFKAELDHALAMLALTPEIAPLVKLSGRLVRVFTLKRTGYLLFVTIDRDAREVRITRLRNTKRRPLHRR